MHKAPGQSHVRWVPKPPPYGWAPSACHKQEIQAVPRPTSSQTPPFGWARSAHHEQGTRCNTRFIKEHKPSNHIRARIKSHVYTIEWIVYHSTYHVKRYNKVSTDVIYDMNDKNVWYSGSVNTYTKTLRSWAPQGRRLGDDRLEVLVLLVALGELLRVAGNWAAVGYSQRGQEEKSRVGKSEYTTCTQQV